MTNDAILHRAPQRIERTLVVLCGISTVLAVALGRPHDALGIGIGAAAAFLNFRWLRTSIVGLTNRLVANPEATGSAALLILRFLLRYAVVGAIVYATLKGSVASGLGVCAGLLLIVPALMFEAVYEFYLSRQQTPVS